MHTIISTEQRPIKLWLDEASGAYKDISTVMTNQSDLVDIKVELRPLAVIKG